MTAKSVLRGILLILSLSTTLYPGIKAQSAPSTTENEAWPEGDLHIQLTSHLRILSFVGLEQAAGYPFQQWYVASALGYQFKPIRRPHWINIDPDKEHYLLFGAGYEFLRTTRSGEISEENRLTLDATPGLRPWARLLLRDRNWLECRWINGTYSTTYRNMVSVEGDARLHGIRFTPFGTFEVFYDSPKSSWDQEWYTAGLQLPYKRVFMLETYYRREHCATCTPQNWNAGGATLHLFVQRLQ